VSTLRFWMVLGEGTPCYRHLTRSAACTEAERLARLAPNQEFVVLEAIAIVKKSDVTWQRLDEMPSENDVPF